MSTSQRMNHRRRCLLWNYALWIAVSSQHVKPWLKCSTHNVNSTEMALLVFAPLERSQKHVRDVSILFDSFDEKLISQPPVCQGKILGRSWELSSSMLLLLFEGETPSTEWLDGQTLSTVWATLDEGSESEMADTNERNFTLDSCILSSSLWCWMLAICRSCNRYLSVRVTCIMNSPIVIIENSRIPLQVTPNRTRLCTLRYRTTTVTMKSPTSMMDLDFSRWSEQVDGDA